jgi:hypothetical protein
MSNVHRYFLEAAIVWELYLAGDISRTKREEELAALRKQYFKKEV